jgi:hypothetical protein
MGQIPECPFSREFVKEYKDDLSDFLKETDPRDIDDHCAFYDELKTYAMETLDMTETEVEALMYVDPELI